MRNKLEEKLSRFEELEAKLIDPEVLGNPQQLAQVAREHGSLSRLALKYRAFKKVIDEILEVSEMAQSSDPQEREMAEAELPQLKQQREEIWEELLDMTVGGDDANRDRCVMEIRAGTGGDEAALFARDLYRMYYKAWHIEVTPGKISTGRHPLFCCYADSDDGIHWRKPELGLHAFGGSKKNNIVKGLKK